MFSKNEFQQLSFNDFVLNMPEYLKKILEDSWAYPFQQVIFPAIDEDRFEVLYSDKPSRPNSPVNVIIGALILKEIFGLSDAELLASIYFDDRFQYALCLTSEEKPPVSINTFSNFRKRVYAYEKETGRDLIKEEVESLSELIAQTLEIDNEKVRVDSFMVASSCKNLSRIELVYTVNANLIKKFNQLDNAAIPESCLSYLDKGHKNETIYKTRDKESESKLDFLLKQSQILYRAALESKSKISKTEEFELLKRMLGEQTDHDDFDDLDPDDIEAKDAKKLDSDILQNPSDPDATYRFKYSANIGYTANVVEVFDGDNSIIKNYDFKENIYSDQKFSADTINNLAKETSLDNPLKMIVDGAYFTIDLAKKAVAKGIELIPGQLTGRKQSKSKMSYGTTFNLNEDNLVTSCINGEEPFYSNYDSEKDVCTAKFSKKVCAACSLKKECRIQFQKKANTARFEKDRYLRDIYRNRMKTDEFIELTNQRAGVEGLPSVFRRFYNVDSMPVRGKLRSKLYFGFKVLASNVKKLFKSPGIVTG
ncbi:transposase-like protein DUF772 [Halanaerobium sp. DL-01]|uniref:transposase n=1 Tax=Halanaerobium sp. DL-01 TaxID=1653064 RepID=UPI000DF2A633|nr:transposase [Halanaerobium sp. DL-01]RCW77915.1 transposase-like protein DUF772 [Halanaerobium sp. DL-01]